MAPLSLFREASAAPLFLSRVISSTSVGIAHVALAWGVMGMGYGARELALVLACNAFPALLILIGGVLGDRFRRHHVLMGAEILAGLAWLALGAAFSMDRAPLPLLCALAGAGGVATAIFLPTVRGIIADLLACGKRPAGNALINQTESVGHLIGFVSAGAVVILAGPAWAAGARGTLCGISAVLLSRLNTRRPRQTGSGGLLGDLSDGWREFKGRPWVWIMTLHFTVITTALVCYMKIVGPLYTANGHGGALAWGLISAAQPLGALVGAMIGACWRPAQLISVTALLPVSVSIPMLLMGGEAPWPAIAMAALVPGTAQAIYYVFWTTALQDKIPHAVLVRVTSWNMVTGYVLMPVTVLLSGHLVAGFGLQVIVLAAAAAAVAATALTLLVLRLLPGVDLAAGAREDTAATMARMNGVTAG
jgi:MFS family permease